MSVKKAKTDFKNELKKMSKNVGWKKKSRYLKAKTFKNFRKHV